MKVVILAGGYGTRLSEYTEQYLNLWYLLVVNQS